VSPGASADTEQTAPRQKRIEHDLLGDLAVPADAYYGVHTVRALANFPVTGSPISRHADLVTALAAVKLACAAANGELGLLDATRATAITRACQEIMAGRHHDQFVVDVLQGGAGTSTNMNANEVIANLSLEWLGEPRGAYDKVHPLDHVNLGQSTNDVYPTAVRVALFRVVHRLKDSLARLRQAFEAKAAEYADAVKIGRTQLQDAVPMTLGQEFRAYAVTIAEDEQRLTDATLLLVEVNLGGTAIGTGLNAPAGFSAAAVEHLRRVTGIPLVAAPNLIEATWDTGAFVQLSGVVKRVALKLSKICNDLRLLASGPRAGLGDVSLPPVQAGSSIMPGKVNPVIPEMVNQVAFMVVGHDMTVTMAAEAGQLQLNAFEPVIAHVLLDGMSMLTEASSLLADRCVRGIAADRAMLRARVQASIGLVTALNPYLGYEGSSAIASEALATGLSVYELVVGRGLLTADQVDAALATMRLVDTRTN
jgi:aspartate ammonia-lyase